MKLESRIVNGIAEASRRSWNYRKDLYEIRPEYLLTVSVADQLIEGFDGIHGFDIEIFLEARTRDVCLKIMKHCVGLSAILKERKRLRLTRRGRLDIFMTSQKRSWAIELKGFDPQAKEIAKEIGRFSEILSANDWDNKCEACYLAFPAQYTTIEMTKKIISKLIKDLPLNADYITHRHETGEDPEDGIPAHNIHVIKIRKN